MAKRTEKPIEPSERPLAIREAAAQLGVHPKTLRRWVRRGQLCALRLPSGRLRFRNSDITAAVSSASDRPPAKGGQPRETS